MDNTRPAPMPSSSRPWLRLVDPATWFAAPLPPPPRRELRDEDYAGSLLLDQQAAEMRRDAMAMEESDARAKMQMRAGMFSDLAKYLDASAHGDTEAARAALRHAQAGHRLMQWVSP